MLILNAFPTRQVTSTSKHHIREDLNGLLTLRCKCNFSYFFYQGRCDWKITSCIFPTQTPWSCSAGSDIHCHFQLSYKIAELRNDFLGTSSSSLFLQLNSLTKHKKRLCTSIIKSKCCVPLTSTTHKKGNETKSYYIRPTNLCNATPKITHLKNPQQITEALDSLLPSSLIADIGHSDACSACLTLEPKCFFYWSK